MHDRHGARVVVGHGDAGGLAIGDQHGDDWQGAAVELELAVVPGNERDVLAGVVGDGVDVGARGTRVDGGGLADGGDA